MKRFVYFAVSVLALLSIVSCKKDKPVKEKNYLDYIIEDYKTLASAYPEAKDNFVEARFTLSGNISEGKVGGIKAETVEIYCYVWLEGKSVISVFVRNFSTGETKKGQYFADSPWVGDVPIPEAELGNLGVSLEEALVSAKNDSDAAAGDGLDTRYVTLRKPLWPVWENPQYVIGGSSSRKDHVFVDAKTGVVSVKENQPDADRITAMMVSDYNTMLDLYNRAEADLRIDLQRHLAEIRFELNAAVNAKPADELYPKKASYVFYAPQAGVSNPDTYLVKGERDFTDMSGELEISVEKTDYVWTDQFIGPEFYDDMLSLDDAIYAVKLANVKDTDTNEVIVRWPKGFENPQFVFVGNTTPDVYIDGITGEIGY